MGIFGLFKSNSESNKNNDIDEILTKLKINPHDFNHDDMEYVELTIDDELNDTIQVSELIYNRDEIPFDYVNLSDKSNGKKSLFLSMSNRDEREIKNLVDLFYKELGEDFIYKKKFTSEDLLEYRSNPSGQLRNWYHLKYDVAIAFSKNNVSDTVYVIVSEK